MPYILGEERQLLNPVLDELFKKVLDNVSEPSEVSPNIPFVNLDKVAGQLNYCFTTLLLKHAEKCASLEGRVTYSHLNELIGVLECCKLELYTRLGSKVEAKAIGRNGDLPLYETL